MKTENNGLQSGILSLGETAAADFADSVEEDLAAAAKAPFFKAGNSSRR